MPMLATIPRVHLLVKSTPFFLPLLLNALVRRSGIDLRLLPTQAAVSWGVLFDPRELRRTKARLGSLPKLPLQKPE